jgi:hypothetical protein
MKSINKKEIQGKPSTLINSGGMTFPKEMISRSKSQGKDEV